MVLRFMGWGSWLGVVMAACFGDEGLSSDSGEVYAG